MIILCFMLSLSYMAYHSNLHECQSHSTKSCHGHHLDLVQYGSVCRNRHQGTRSFYRSTIISEAGCAAGNSDRPTVPARLHHPRWPQTCSARRLLWLSPHYTGRRSKLCDTRRVTFLKSGISTVVYMMYCFIGHHWFVYRWPNTNIEDIISTSWPLLQLMNLSCPQFCEDLPEEDLHKMWKAVKRFTI